MTTRARIIAFYLPQFHPIPENDRWWGKGFTEWTVVARAKPLFPGHYQPHLPADLGFCDLRLPETRAAQAEMAAAHGIEGFCYWHYWLGNGRRLLERPFEEVLSLGEPDFPFCLAWANHSWKGVFFGAKGRTLVEQRYPGPDDDRAHFEALRPAFIDPRYINVEGKPLLFVFFPPDLPDPNRFVERWQKMALETGLKGFYLVGGGISSAEAARMGFDAASPYRHRIVDRRWPRNRYLRQAVHRFRGRLNLPAVYTYRRAMQYFLPGPPCPEDEHPVIVPNWDTTPRLGRKALVLQGATPELFRRHVADAMDLVADRDPEHRIVFVKSWNEWAEGNHLEPDLKYGRGHLEALRDGVVVPP